MASGKEEPSTGHDAELDELLDSALDDFDKTSAAAASAPAAASSSASTGAEKPLIPEISKLFETLFEGDMAAKAQELLEKLMTELAQKQPELVQHLQKSAGTYTASLQEIIPSLKETLRDLAKNAENLQASGLTGDDLVKALKGLRLEDGSEGGNEDGNILPILEPILANLLCKMVLYPCVKITMAEYPEWLDSNKSSLSPEDFQRYEQQAKIMGEICGHFEKDEGARMKDSTFESIMDLMDELDDLGEPPEELAGDALPGFNFDPESLNLPGDSDLGAEKQCSIM